MKESTRNLLVGFFVVGSCVVFGLLMVWFGETPDWLGRSEWTLRIVGVDALSGIDEGSPVYLNGVQIGRVRTLEFENVERPGRGVVIVTRIKRQYSVPSDARAKVYGATLGIGMGYVAIVVEPDAKGKPLDKEIAFITGEMHSMLSEVISEEFVGSLEQTVIHIGDLAKAAQPVADNLATLLEERTVADVSRPGAAEQGVTANVATVIERIDQLATHINEILGDENVQEEVKSAVRDLKDATDQLRTTFALWNKESQRISDNLNSGIDETREDLRQSFVALSQILENLDEASKSMAQVLYRVAEGEGTAGLLSRDERLYEAAVLSLERFAELLGSFQRITGKIERDGYVTIGQTTPVGTFTRDFPVAQPQIEAPRTD